MSKTEVAATENVEVSSTETSDVKNLLQTLLDDSSNLQTLYKTWTHSLKKLAKEIDKEQKKLCVKSDYRMAMLVKTFTTFAP